MSITNIQTLHDLAEISLACYAYLNSNARTDSALAAGLQDPVVGAAFTPDQAASFVAKYKLLPTQPNVEYNGFSGTVFQDKQTGVKVLALRGTEFTQGLGQQLVDGLVADGLGDLPEPKRNDLHCREAA